MIGPGRYDALCTHVRLQAKAAGAIVIVLGGEKGDGFSAQLSPLMDGATIAWLLRDMARQIERDYPHGGRV